MRLVLEILQTLYKLGWLLGIKETFSEKQLGWTTHTLYWTSCGSFIHSIVCSSLQRCLQGHVFTWTSCHIWSLIGKSACFFFSSIVAFPSFSQKKHKTEISCWILLSYHNIISLDSWLHVKNHWHTFISFLFNSFVFIILFLSVYICVCTCMCEGQPKHFFPLPFIQSLLWFCSSSSKLGLLTTKTQGLACLCFKFTWITSVLKYELSA